MPKQKASPKKKDLTPPSIAQLQPRLYENLRKVVSQLVNGKNYHPMTLRELMGKLQLPDQHLEVFEEVLNSLMKDGSLHLNHGRYEIKKVSLNTTILGVIRIHFRGFGFVKPDEPTPYTEDIFIPKHLTMNAVDGDKVEVEVNPEISEKGPEGKVTSITSRSRTHVAGIVLSVSPYGEVEAYAPLFGISRRILVETTPKSPLKRGDRIVMKVVDWGSREGNTHCQFTNHIGHISDASCDIPAAIEEFGLSSTFSKKTLEEAEKWGKVVPREEIDEREDTRNLECVTIDPDTAKDFDDAITLTKDKNGHYHLGVHIADVSYYVKEGSELDREARSRCNSTYFPGTCLPMLPPMLSENLCSLKPNVNRLTVSVFMDFDEKGTLLNYRIARSVIKSAKRFTYREAKEILDGTKKSPHSDLLNLMVELCSHLKAIRHERGSIEFSLPDLIVKIDEKGVPTNVEYVAYDITHQMIEEFMLKANEIVALHLSKAGKGVAYRVHDEPSGENMKDFCALAAAFGFTLNDPPTSKELQDFFYEALQTSYGEYLATSFIRRMRQALYSPENIGHYGLGLTHYCHFTSPIRRYVDLVVHRTIFEEAQTGSKLDQITQECSEQERISAKAENSVVMLKKLRLIDGVHKTDRYKQYDAVVTRVKQFGFSFEIIDYMLEGFFHVSELDGDYFIYEEAGVKLRGRHTGKVYTAGERITVMVKEIDLLRLESKWSLVSERPARIENNNYSSRKPHRRDERRFGGKPKAGKAFKPAYGQPIAKQNEAEQSIPAAKNFDKSKKPRYADKIVRTHHRPVESLKNKPQEATYQNAVPKETKKHTKVSIQHSAPAVKKVKALQPAKPVDTTVKVGAPMTIKKDKIVVAKKPVVAASKATPAVVKVIKANVTPKTEKATVKVEAPVIKKAKAIAAKKPAVTISKIPTPAAKVGKAKAAPKSVKASVKIAVPITKVKATVKPKAPEVKKTRVAEGKKTIIAEVKKPKEQVAKTSVKAPPKKQPLTTSKTSKTKVAAKPVKTAVKVTVMPQAKKIKNVKIQEVKKPLKTEAKKLPTRAPSLKAKVASKPVQTKAAKTVKVETLKSQASKVKPIVPKNTQKSSKNSAVKLPAKNVKKTLPKTKPQTQVTAKPLKVSAPKIEKKALKPALKASTFASPAKSKIKDVAAIKVTKKTVPKEKQLPPKKAKPTLSTKRRKT